jgi:Domain of unknown function (DUF5047)
VETITDIFRRQLVSADPVTTVDVEVLIGGSERNRFDISSYFSDGALTVARQQIMRAGTLTFVDRDGSGLIVPTDQDSLLAAYGNQLRVRAGLVYPDGGEELVVVGTLRITGTRSRYPNCTVEVSDRGWIVQNATLEAPWHVSAGTQWEDAIIELLLDRYPAAEFDIPIRAETTTPAITLDEAANPWDALQTWAAQACGGRLFFDPLGVCRLTEETILSGGNAPVWSYNGAPASLPYDEQDWTNLALYDEEKNWTTENSFNRVIVTGTSSSGVTSVRGIATDDDPDSPTRYDGPFGKKPRSLTSELITTTPQAELAALTELQSVLGLGETLKIPSIVNPALAPGDSIQVTRPELGIDTVHVIDEFPLPLRGGRQDLTTRVRRVIAA